MIYILYTQDVNQIVAAVNIDARATTMQLGWNGIEVQAFLDEILSLFTENTLLYKLETELGVLAGYFTLDVIRSKKTAIRSSLVLRPAFQINQVDIIAQTDAFITRNDWNDDILF